MQLAITEKIYKAGVVIRLSHWFHRDTGMDRYETRGTYRSGTNHTRNSSTLSFSLKRLLYWVRDLFHAQIIVCT